MNVVIYAAGRGTRFGSMTEAIPKSLLTVAGKPLIEYALMRSATFNPDCIAIVVGYHAEAIKSVVGNSYQGRPIQYVFNEQYMLTGNMTSLWAAREFCKGDTMFTTSDMICARSDIEQMAVAPARDKILIDQNPQYFNDPEPVKVALRDGYIKEVRKRDFNGAVTGAAMGIYCFGASAMAQLISLIGERVRSGTVDASLYYAINELCQSVAVSPIYTGGSRWFDLDTPEELAEADPWVQAHKGIYQ